MTDREKVIRGLELCAYDPDPGQELKEIRSCPECPYYRAGCSPQLIRDALALLKEQEPRVMTLEETIALCGEPVWLEEDTLQGSYGAWGVVKELHEQYKAVNIGGVRFTYWPRAKYNITWRCWTSRPTPEQMRDTKWEGEEDHEA